MATPVAIIGSGNIGTDLMIKIIRNSDVLDARYMVGIDPSSDGLARARRLGLIAVENGVEELVSHPDFADVRIVFDATSAEAHRANARVLSAYDVRLVDLTPAALGPFVVPPVNLDQLHDVTDVNMVTCGGQATVPVVAAITEVTDVPYAEIVASIASRSAGPGTRANIDEFTQTTARAIEQVGGAARGKAIIMINPAEPPMLMRDTVLCVVEAGVDRAAIARAVDAMVSRVASYVPGYRLKQEVQFTALVSDQALSGLLGDLYVENTEYVKVSVFLEVEGAAHYLPAYAGNLDIMTSAALRVGEQIASRMSAAPSAEVVR